MEVAWSGSRIVKGAKTLSPCHQTRPKFLSGNRNKTCAASGCFDVQDVRETRGHGCSSAPLTVLAMQISRCDRHENSMVLSTLKPAHMPCRTSLERRRIELDKENSKCFSNEIPIVKVTLGRGKRTNVRALYAFGHNRHVLSPSALRPWPRPDACRGLCGFRMESELQLPDS